MSVRFQLDHSQIQELERKMGRLPHRMEKVINEVFHNDGIEIATSEITKLLPVSKWKNRIRNKTHAKNSNWSTSERHNLGFTVKSRGGAAEKKGSYGYLVFPNEGRGGSNPIDQRFMERGLEKATPRILDLLNQRIDRTLEEEL